jgi:hypothetical protein
MEVYFIYKSSVDGFRRGPAKFVSTGKPHVIIQELFD